MFHIRTPTLFLLTFALAGNRAGRLLLEGAAADNSVDAPVMQDIGALTNQNLSNEVNDSLLPTAAAQPTCTNTTELVRILLDVNGYSKYRVPERPNSDMGVLVTVEFWIIGITSIHEATNDFEMEIYINELWLDPALKYSHLNPCRQNLSLSSEVLDRLWTPNSCFVNSKVAHIYTSPFRNIFLTVFSNGTVWVNYRVQIKGPCEMELTKFPLDRQKCGLIYESFNYNNKEVQMRWNPDLDSPVYTLLPIQLPDFDLIDIRVLNKSEIYPAGYWDELHLSLIFKRRVTFFIGQAYVPTFLTILLSWISFPLGHTVRVIPARTTLGVSSLLAMIFQFSNIMSSLPRVSYVKAIDVWMLTCMSFIFMSLLEFGLIGFLVRECSPETKKLREAAKQKSAAMSKAASSVSLAQMAAAHAPYVKTETALVDGASPLTTKRRSVHFEDADEHGEMGGAHNTDEPPEQFRIGDTKYMLDLAKYARQDGKRGCFGCMAKRCKQLMSFVHVTPDKVDRAAIIGFPTMFSLFNIVYWTYYVNKPDQADI